MNRLEFGDSIGVKFDEYGEALTYLGNSIVCEVNFRDKRYASIYEASRRIQKSEWGERYIWLPPESYHVTVIQGVNDQVRLPTHWSVFKSLNTPLEEMDLFFSKQLQGVQSFGEAEFYIETFQNDDQDLRIVLTSKDESTENRLRQYRDHVSERFGVRLPNHDTYKFHLTLAYVLRKLSADEKAKMEEMLNEVLQDLQQQVGTVIIRNPQLTFYQNMLSFPTKRIGS